MGPGKRGWQSIYNMGDEKMHRLEDNNPHAPRVGCCCSCHGY